MKRFLRRITPDAETANNLSLWFHGIGKGIVALAIGAIGSFFLVNMNAGPGTVISSQEEAVGLEFRDPAFLDIVTHFKRSRVCPSETQRYVWKWVDYNGVRLQNAIPIASTLAPFFADSSQIMITVPNPGIPTDQLKDSWFLRTIVTERCGFLPSWANSMFGTRVYRSPDQPVNFVGDPHDK